VRTISLTATGRRSGKPRSVTLYGYADGERIVVVGSNGGSRVDPGWVHNLRANAHATVKRGREVLEVTATEASGEERERLWDLACSDFPLYRRYQQRTDRQIAVFSLTPVAK
jgi:deazaflavin-dependent oxidoreductase (nitroreductase family)